MEPVLVVDGLCVVEDCIVVYSVVDVVEDLRAVDDCVVDGLGVVENCVVVGFEVVDCVVDPVVEDLRVVDDCVVDDSVVVGCEVVKCVVDCGVVEGSDVVVLGVVVVVVITSLQ